MDRAPQMDDLRFTGCHVAADAKIASDVTLGYGTVIHPGVEIEAGVVIDEHCVIGIAQQDAAPHLVIPRGSRIRSHTAIYRGSRFGPELETGHHVLIRENTVAGENLRIGSYSDIEGDCELGDFCRIHGYVHIGKGSRIGHFVWLFSLTTAANDPFPPCELRAPVEVADGAVVCVGTTLMPGAKLAKGAYASAGAIVTGSVPAGAVLDRSGKVVGHVATLLHLESGLRHPWMRHAKDKYPARAHARIEALLQEIMASRHELEID